MAPSHPPENRRNADSFIRIRDTVIIALVLGIGTFFTWTVSSTLKGVNATLEKHDETQREVVLNQSRILLIQDHHAKRLDEHDNDIKDIDHQLRPVPEHR